MGTVTERFLRTVFICGVLLLGAIALSIGVAIVVVLAATNDVATSSSNHVLVLVGVGALLGVTVVAALALLVHRFRQAQQASAALAIAERDRLTKAIDNMSQGLLLFDNDEKIVVCNRRYIDMYGLSSEVVKPGCGFRDLLQHRRDVGSFAGDVNNYYDDLANALQEGKPFSIVFDAPDGRSIQVVNQPLADGGWVATHEDITLQRIAEISRARSWEFLNTLIDNVPVAIMVKDAVDRRFLLANRAAEELWKMPRCDVIGKTARELFPPEQATLIDKRDDEVLSSYQPIVLGAHPNLARGGDARIVTSKRIALRDENGAPEHLVTVVEDITEQKHAETKIAYLAHHDALTDLPNRVVFRENLEASLRALGEGERVALLYLDLDNFKGINDALGHPVGDAFLKAVSARLLACIEADDIVCRLGGDEFAIVRRRVVAPEDAVGFAEKIYDRLREPCLADGHLLVAHTSIGIAIAPDDGSEPDRLMKYADLALYAAKAAGRGVYRFFRAEMIAHLEERQALEEDLRKALEGQQFELHYQPLVSSTDASLVGCEALLRWRHPKRGMISPAEFIPVAEDSGLIGEIGQWVLETACREAATWSSHLKVAVNVSPLQFRSAGFPLKVITALLTSGLPAQRLELELTEALLMRDDEEMLRMLKDIREFGVRIAMDDFGTGYSSLRYLQQFPFDKIKIDKSFISDLTGPDGSRSIVEAVINIAKAKNIVTTAEGVETDAQLQILRDLGCTEIQGFLFSRPKPAREIAALRTAARSRDASTTECLRLTEGTAQMVRKGLTKSRLNHG